MSRADDREQERYLQQCIDTMWGNYALRDMLTDGFERLVGSARRQTVHFPKLRPLPVKAPPDPPLATLFESTVTITLPDDRRAVREPTLDEIKAIRGKLDEWHNGLLDELLGGPINNGVAHPGPARTPSSSSFFDKMGTVSSGTTPTIEDLKRAYGVLNADPRDPLFSPYGASPFAPQPMRTQQGVPPADVEFERLLRESGCRDRGCAVQIGYSIMKLATVIVHNGDEYLVNDAVRARGGMDEVREQFLRWTYQVHGGRVGDMPEQYRNLCYLCGRERDPDVEPVVLDAKALHPELAKLGNGHAIDGATVEACSPECATAYAIRLEPVRSQPALGRFFEQRHQERHATLGTSVTDSTPAIRRNPWKDTHGPTPTGPTPTGPTPTGPTPTLKTRFVVTTQEYGVWTISDDPSDDAA